MSSTWAGIAPEEAVARYLALSYGYTADGSGSDRKAPLSPEEEEFNECDAGLLASCKAPGDGARHFKQISESDDFVIFERNVGGMLHRFRSKFIAKGTEMVPKQYTEILCPEHFGDKGLVFPLNKELGEAGCMFQSALVLGNFMSDRSCVLSTYMTGERRIVELGCGTGLLGIIIAQMGQKIMLTDLRHVLPQIEENVRVNLEGEAAERVEVAAMAWGNEDDEKTSGRFDLILCSDLVYKEETKEALVHTLVALSTPDSLVAMAFERRRKTVEDSFMQLAAEHFAVEELEIPYKEENGVLVFLMRPK
mmetsp:Transcript_3248/g.8141  ORF Transcript_3248/g.8141 Transcript_3248/m.8141 type:complete len:307 (-) Transcript_3248:82-1002(-)